MRIVALFVVALLFVPQVAQAVITFTQLDDDLFVVSHRVKLIGSRARAMKFAYEKAASLCVAAGFSHFRILDQESEAGQEDDAANASVRVRYYFADGEERIDCEENASSEYVGQAGEKLRAMGYRPPDPAAEAEAAAAGATGTCTVAQITAMAKAGLSDAQIEAACSVEPDR